MTYSSEARSALSSDPLAARSGGHHGGQYKKLSGNVSQRRRNVRLAETSAAMSIFLSKNQLGMRDDFAVSGKVDHEHTMLHVLLQELGDGTHGKVIQHDETER